MASLDTLPAELFNHILSYLIYPRSRLPGLTEWQSSRACPRVQRKAAQDAYFLNPTAPPDTPRFGDDIFSLEDLPHPFNALALTSRRLRDLTERYCVYLVQTYKVFNLPLPLAGIDRLASVHPRLDAIVFRRLWLQSAPRLCLYCGAACSVYPHAGGLPVFLPCRDCYDAQVLTTGEVEEHFHLSLLDLAANSVRGSSPRWVLRIDVEALALQLYGSKAFHDRGERKICRVCIQAGTLSRIVAIRAQRHALIWSEMPDTGGWIVQAKGGLEEDGEEGGFEGVGRGRLGKWPRFFRYAWDPYVYRDDDRPIDGGYNLRFNDL